METVGIVSIGILLITFWIVMLARDEKKRKERKERGEPTPQEEAKRKRHLEIENLTNALKQKIPQDETIVVVVEGVLETFVLGNGIFAATDKRLIIYQKQSKVTTLLVFGYDTIYAVETKSSWIGTSIIITSDKKIVNDEKIRIKHINEQDEAVEQFTEYIRKKQVEDVEPNPSESNPPEPAPDIPNQIRGLAELKDQGILTEEEFNAKKQDLLDRL